MKILRSWLVVLAVSNAGSAFAVDMAEVLKLMEQKRYDDVVSALTPEVEENPANDEARILLADAFEKAGRLDEALAAWTDLRTVTQNAENKYKARLKRNRLLRIMYDDRLENDPGTDWMPPDYFKMIDDELDFRGLQVLESTKYINPPRKLSAGVFGFKYPLPPFQHVTEHLTIYTSNEKMGELIGELTEIQISFMEEHLFGGEHMTFHFPLIVFANLGELQSAMGPGMLGAAGFHPFSGRTRFIVMFQNSDKKAKHKAPNGSEELVALHSITDTLFHEMLHAIFNEYFGSAEKGFWLNEGLATRSQQMRDHDKEAARIAQRAAGGTIFRLRDLFTAGRLTSPHWKVALVYEQGAAITKFMFELGPDAMYCFMKERAKGNSWDAAVSAALGIPEEGAIEEFEARWHKWLRRRYAHDSDLEYIEAIVSEAGVSDNKLFLPWVNEVETVHEMDDWRDVDLTSLEPFTGVGRSLEHWSSSGGRLRCDVPEGAGPSLLGIRMNEEAPVAVTCNVRYLDTPGDRRAWFGFTQLDADRNDTRIEVTTPLSDGSAHEMVCLWTDDLVIYIDGKCTGRYPAYQIGENDRNVNYPIALVAYGPVEVSDLRVGKIERFSRKPVPGREEKEEENSRKGRRRGGRRLGGPRGLKP